MFSAMIIVILSLPVPLEGDIVIHGESLEADHDVFGGAVKKCQSKDVRYTEVPSKTSKIS